MREIVPTLFTIIATLAILILISLLLIKVGWALFMVPVFNLPDLSWMQAFGFSLLTSAFKQSSVGKKE